MLKNPKSVKKILGRKNSLAISFQVSPASVLNVSAGNYQTALVEN
jgi:hypothetical protein